MTIFDALHCWPAQIFQSPYNQYVSLKFAWPPRTAFKNGHYKWLTLLLFGFCFPCVTNAAVTINEVAWMGTASSANDEWIELHNSGSQVSVDGWTLSDGMNLEIELAGTLAGNAYAVLERTDDDSAPGGAFLIYTGALTNSGATLTLRRSNGGIEDQVAGGENWQNIGGDNATKETAQYTTSGWVTGVATPGKQNVSQNSAPPQPESEDEEQIEEDEAGSGASSNDTHISLERPGNELALSIDGPVRGYVNQAIGFFAEPEGLGERIMDSLVYTWNFGDLQTSSGAEVVVQYPYPGEYVVVVEGVYTDYEARARHTITILPTTLSLERNQNGDVLVHNNANYEVDLSGYQLRSRHSKEFPPYTILAPRATLTVQEEQVGATGLITTLYDAAGESVAMLLPSQLQQSARVAATLTPAPLPPAPVAAVASARAPVAVARAPQISATSTSVAAASPSAADAAGLAAVANAAEMTNGTTAGIPNEKLPYLGLMAIITIGILALYTRAPRTEKEQPFGLK